MSTPNKQYKVFNIAETNPTGVPDAGFVWMFPRDAAIWVRLPNGTEYQLLKFSQTGSASIPVWTINTDNIVIGSYFLYADFLYRALQPSSSSDPKQPDLFIGTFWESVDLTDLAHAQNTDFKLGVHKSDVLDPYDNEFLLYTSTYNTKNYLQIGDDQLQWDTDEEITLKTFDSVSGNFADQEFFVKVVNDGQTGRAVFTTNAFQDVGDGLILSDGDCAVFKGNVDGVTQLIATSVDRSTEPALTISQVSTDVYPNIIATALAVEITAESDQVNMGGSHTTNEHVGKYIVATGTTITSLTLHKITANNTVGLITLATPIIETATYNLQLVEPTAIVMTDTDNNVRVYASDNIVIRVPAIAVGDNGNIVSILRETGGDETKKVWIELQNNLNGSALHSLLSDGDLIEFSAHTTGTHHFDLLNRIINT